MRATRGTAVAGVVVAVLAAGCAGPGDRAVVEDQAAGGPPPRTSWQLRHRIQESGRLRVVGRHADAYGESSSVRLRRDDGTSEECVVALTAPGYGGPEHWVGQQLATRVRGRPAVRNGAGAEAGYVLWRLDDGAWVEVFCDELEDRRPVEQVVAAVRLRRAPIPVPFGLAELPQGFAVASVDQGADVVQVHLGRVSPRTGTAGADLEIRYGTGERAQRPTGRSVTVGGRPALVQDEPRDPSVCVAVQGRHVCVFHTPDDTDPDADHGEDVPTLLAVASALTFAPDLGDRTTWFTADHVLG